MRTALFALVVAIALASSGVYAFKLTHENFDTATADKQVFIKFYAPWCGHCQEIAPKWEKLMASFAGSKTSLVAELDCAEEAHEPLCQKLKIDGYPTMRYGTVKAGLKDYDGKNEFEDMLVFAQANLGPVCGPKHVDLCSEEDKKLITEGEAMSDADITATLKAKADQTTAADKELEELQIKFQAQFELATEAHKKKVKEISDGGNSMLAAICKERAGCTVPEKPKPKAEDEDYELPNEDGDKDAEEEDDAPAAPDAADEDEPEEPGPVDTAEGEGDGSETTTAGDSGDEAFSAEMPPVPEGEGEAGPVTPPEEKAEL